MTCGHLFNGIGGFAIAAHWMGWANVMHCEIDPFCNKVMNYHFPNSYQHEDIRTTDFTIWRGKLDLITGGFPCQPYSTAGKRKGKDDDRHLWPQMLRAIREIQPGWIVGENVRGLTNWNGGLVFEEVQADLEAEGYEVLPFLLPAAGVNAPHRRDRIWFIAHANSSRFGRHNSIGEDRCKEKAHEGTEQREERNEIQWERFRSNIGGNAATGINPDATGVGLEGGVYDGDSGEKRTGIIEGSKASGIYDKTDWQNFPTQPPVCNRNDGLSLGLADVAVSSKYGTRILKGNQVYGRWRKESIKAMGNAVVPQIPYLIFKAIQQYEKSIYNL